MHRFALAAALLAPVISHADFMSFNLGSLTESGTWTDLSNANYTSAEGYPGNFPGGSSWTTPITASGLDANLNMVSGQSWFSSSSYIYNFAASSYTISTSTPITGLETLVLQLENNEGFSSITLNYNGGTQELAASYIGTYTGTHSSTGPEGTSYSNVDVYQWDLSSVIGSITDYTINLTTNEHTVWYGISLSEGNTYSAIAVPEPSTYAALAGLGVLGFVLLRRRNLSQK